MARAGSASKLRAHMEELCRSQVDKMIDAVLSQGAANTINGHAERWRSIELWRSSLANKNAKEGVYPPSLTLIVAYTSAVVD